jgi:hypothetical protein
VNSFWGNVLLNLGQAFFAKKTGEANLPIPTPEGYAQRSLGNKHVKDYLATLSTKAEKDAVKGAALAFARANLGALENDARAAVKAVRG